MTKLELWLVIIDLILNIYEIYQASKSDKEIKKIKVKMYEGR